MAKRRARGEGSLRKRSDGRWEGRYTVGRDENGKLLYRNVGSFPYQLKDHDFVSVYHEYVVGMMYSDNTFCLEFN